MLSTAIEAKYHTMTGTSVSAVIGAGIIALTLEANPELTWRDVQHLIVRSSSFEHLSVSDYIFRRSVFEFLLDIICFLLQDEKYGWSQNAAGYNYSSWHGFGLMNANAMVTLAKNWTNVPKKSTCKVVLKNSYFIKVTEEDSYGKPLKGKVTIDAEKCKHIKRIEHVQYLPNLTMGELKRGSFNVSLT